MKIKLEFKLLFGKLIKIDKIWIIIFLRKNRKY